MTIRKKMTLIFAGSIIALALIIYVLAQTVLLGGFRDLEKMKAIDDVDRAVSVIKRDTTKLVDFSEDWGSWDDTYRFVVDKNQNYIDRNLTAYTFVSQQINILIFIDNTGKVVYGKAYDFDADCEIPWPRQLENYASTGSPLLAFDTLAKNNSGIISLPEGPMLIAAQPITPSGRQGPIRGTLVVGRFLSKERIRELADIMQNSIEVVAINNGGVLGEYNKDWHTQQERVAITTTEDSISGYTVLNDIYGSPAIVIKTVGKRAIYQAGHVMLEYFILALLISGLVLTAIVVVLMEKSVLSRLTSLHSGVVEIAATSNVAKRVNMQGVDELAGLAKAINGMLAALENSQADLLHYSLYDSLTGVYNRSFFEEHLRKKSPDIDGQISLIVCDIDGLKLVNDSLGHQQGDSLLIAAANVLKVCCPANAKIARTGGDEFVIMLSGSEQQADQICQSVRQAVNQYNQAHTGTLCVLSMSLGVAGSTSVQQDIAGLFKQADSAMYREKLHRSRSARSAVVNTLKQTLAIRDYITDGHAQRLIELIVRFADACGLSSARINDLHLFAEFHDIGKVGIPDSILFKPGPLTTEEWEIMKQHAEIGYRISQAAPDFAPIADWTLKHHEWWNGQGYPLGLKGEDIPIESRMLAIVDAYDAMTHDRPYRQAMTTSQAIAEIKRLSGAQFDPRLVQIFLSIIE